MAIVKTLTKVFGLATVSLFGRIPTRDADRMAAIGLAALSWPPVLVAVVVPEAAEAMIPFAPDDDSVLRAIAVVTAVALPLAVGWGVGRLHNHRGLGAAHRRTELLRGFRYVPVIALTVTAVLVVLPPLAVVRLVRGWEAGRLMVRVPSGGLDDAVDHLRDILDHAGHRAEEVTPPRSLQVLFRALGHVLRDIFRLEVAPELRVLRGEDRCGGPFELTVHAADLAIIGPRGQVTRIHATLAEELDLRRIGVTWDDRTVALEHDITDLRDQLEAGEQVPLDEVSRLIAELGGSSLDQESWSAVRRALHRLERDVLRARLGLGPPTATTADRSSATE